MGPADSQEERLGGGGCWSSTDPTVPPVFPQCPGQRSVSWSYPPNAAWRVVKNVSSEYPPRMLVCVLRTLDEWGILCSAGHPPLPYSRGILWEQRNGMHPVDIWILSEHPDWRNTHRSFHLVESDERIRAECISTDWTALTQRRFT